MARLFVWRLRVSVSAVRSASPWCTEIECCPPIERGWKRRHEERRSACPSRLPPAVDRLHGLEGISSVGAVDIVTQTTDHTVLPIAVISPKLVASTACEQRVRALHVPHHVGTAPTEEPIVSAPASDLVPSGASTDVVVPAATEDIVVSATAVDDVRELVHHADDWASIHLEGWIVEWNKLEGLSVGD